MSVFHSVRRAAFFGCAVVAAGCAATPRSIETPRVEVVGLTALSSTAETQRFSVNLLLDNPNVEPLVIEELTFMLRLASEGRMNGRSTGPITIPALDRQTVRIDVESDIVSSLSRLLAVVQGSANTLPYELAGNLRLDRTFQNTLPFTFRGEVPLATSSAAN
jgi:LEA14-like dessication related protein